MLWQIFRLKSSRANLCIEVDDACIGRKRDASKHGKVLADRGEERVNRCESTCRVHLCIPVILMANRHPSTSEGKNNNINNNNKNSSSSWVEEGVLSTDIGEKETNLKGQGGRVLGGSRA